MANSPTKGNISKIFEQGIFVKFTPEWSPEPQEGLFIGRIFQAARVQAIFLISARSVIRSWWICPNEQIQMT